MADWTSYPSTFYPYVAYYQQISSTFVFLYVFFYEDDEVHEDDDVYDEAHEDDDVYDDVYDVYDVYDVLDYWILQMKRKKKKYFDFFYDISSNSSFP